MTTSAEGVSDAIRHTVLRDLAWLLATPDLVTLGAYPGRPTGLTLGLADNHHAWLTALLPGVEALPHGGGVPMYSLQTNCAAGGETGATDDPRMPLERADQVTAVACITWRRADEGFSK